MKITKKYIIKFLRDNEKYLENEFGVKKIALFGSYSRNESQKKSDIDILIEVDKKDFKNRFFLKEYLRQNLNKEIDVFYFDSLRSFIRKNIEQDLIYV